MSLYKGTKLVSGGTPKIPFATKDIAGLVKIGSGININEDGTISVDIPDVDMSVVSDAWDSSKVYAVGDYCIHNNVLYKCHVQNTGSEPTEGNTNWGKSSVGAEMSQINSNLSAIGSIQEYSIDTPMTIPNGQETKITDINLPKGSTWLLDVSFNWPDYVFPPAISTIELHVKYGNKSVTCGIHAASMARFIPMMINLGENESKITLSTMQYFGDMTNVTFDIQLLRLR